jgi:hypothetical protein
MTMHYITSVIIPDNATTFATFSSIPQTYSHLQVRSHFRPFTTSAGDYQLSMTLNGDQYPNTNYSGHVMYGRGTSTVNNFTQGVGQWQGIAGIYGNYDSGSLTPVTNNFASAITDILDYSSTSKVKTIRSVYAVDLNGSGMIGTASAVKIASSPTSAVTSMNLFCAGTGHTWTAGTRFDLYGITTNPIATGA